MCYKNGKTQCTYEPRHEISHNAVCAIAKAQTSLRIQAVLSELLQVALIFYDC